MVDARQYHGLKKRSRFFSGFPFEQFRSQETASHRHLVFHSPKGYPTPPSSSVSPLAQVGVSDLPMAGRDNSINRRLCLPGGNLSLAPLAGGTVPVASAVRGGARWGAPTVPVGL